jgi:6-phosphogluconolactonase
MIKIFDDAEQLNRFAAEKFVEIADEAIKNRGQFTVALAGGSTPKSFYQLLGSEELKNKIDWSKVYFFFGDERNVTPDDAESNFRMANENLFEPLRTPDKNVFRWQTEIEGAENIAAVYVETLIKFFTQREKSHVQAVSFDRPHFDLILLGMGDDGHTASLFPFTTALNETERIAVANQVEKLDTIRFTLTFPVINNARNVIFLVKGADKAETLRQVLQGEFQPEKYPSQNVKPVSGNLFWLVDWEAAKLLR